MKILILASSSFAAQDLFPQLEFAHHDVWTFNRAPLPHSTPKDLSGSYDRLRDIVQAKMQSCDVLINYAIVKHGTIEHNIELTDCILACARQLAVKRLIHISSISVLPSMRGIVDEQAQAVDARWKGVYSRVKSAVERHVIQHWKDSDLVVVRPGFIIAPGMIDSIVGIGRRLPTGQVLGLGNRKSIIPLIERTTVNTAIVRIASAPVQQVPSLTIYMLVAGNAPTREEYLQFQCSALGRGWKTIHVPTMLWRMGLTCASVPMTLFQRRFCRLAKLFEHNLNVRQYDCARTQQALNLDLSVDWRARLQEFVGIGQSCVWPIEFNRRETGSITQLTYFGMGRIVKQRHLPGLLRAGFTGMISWMDPAVAAPPESGKLKIAKKSGLVPGTMHVVVAAPWTARRQILDQFPDSVNHILFEKPFAVSRRQLDLLCRELSGKCVSILHNYRFKSNVIQFRRFLATHPSGMLRAVALHYETPSPALEKSHWMRQERTHRILITDYALHFLDLAWIFCNGPLTIHRCETGWNSRNELESLSAALSFNGVPCDVLIRQGCHQRECVLIYHFQNYTAELRFFPELFVPIGGGRGVMHDARLAGAGLWAIGKKVVEKTGLGARDRSHEIILSSFVGISHSQVLNELSLASLKQFYERLTQLADHVYGSPV